MPEGKLIYRMTKAERAAAQRTLNAFYDKWLDDVRPLIVDGNDGPMTRRYLKLAQHYVGYGKRDLRWTPKLVRRLRHPNDTDHSSAAMIKRGQDRRREQKRHAKKEREDAQRDRADGIVAFDGKPTPVWIADRLEKVRKAGRWVGGVVSGIRSPEHSISLCFGMCGAPSCPGKCAGAASNHNATVVVTDGEGAVDCSDFIRLAQELKRLGIHDLKNDLPRDLVHFSRSGH